VAVGVSIDYAPYFTVNVTVGSNSLPLDASFASRPKDSTTVLRIAVENFEGPRMDLDSIVLNKVRVLRVVHSYLDIGLI